MIGFACCWYRSGVRERCFDAGVRLVAEPDSRVLLSSPNEASIHSFYNRALEAFAREDVEFAALLHEDTEILDADFVTKCRMAFSDPDVAVLGAIGARGVTSLGWWEGRGIGAVHHGTEASIRPGVYFTPREGEVDSVDGLMLVLSGWAVRNLRCDEEIYEAFYGYDNELCFQARKAGKKVVVLETEVRHHTRCGYHNKPAFDRSNQSFRAKWFPSYEGRTP